MAKLYSATGTLAGDTDTLVAAAAFGADIGVEVMIVNLHASLAMTFTDTAGREHSIPAGQSVILPVDFRSGTITGTGVYHFFASTAAGFVARQNISPTIASGSVSTAMLIDEAVTAAKLAAAVAGAGLTGGAGAALDVVAAAAGGLVVSANDMSIKPDVTTGSTRAQILLAANGASIGVDDATIKHTAGVLALKDGALSADAGGRALMATGFFDDATVQDLFGTDSISVTGAADIIADSAIVTAHIADGAVGGIKRAIESKTGLAAAADRVTSAAGPVATAFATKYTIPAGRLVVGSIVRISAVAKVIDSAAGATVAITPRIATVEIGTTPTPVDAADNAIIRIEAELVVISIGAGGTWNGWSLVMIPGGSPSTTAVLAAAVDTTQDRDVDLLVDWAAGGAGDDVDLVSLIVEVIG